MFSASFAVRLLAAVLVLLQAALPASLAMAAESGVDPSRFICSPSGQLTPEAKAAAEQIARLLGEVPDDSPDVEDHCPHCTLAQQAALPVLVQHIAPTRSADHKIFLRHERGLVHEAQGPPLGSRGPPFTS